MESVPHLKPLESYSEVKSSTDLLRNPISPTLDSKAGLLSRSSLSSHLFYRVSTMLGPKSARNASGMWMGCSVSVFTQANSVRARASSAPSLTRVTV